MSALTQPGAPPIQSRPSSSQAWSILTRHFGFQAAAAEVYLTAAARRERRKVTEIENAVINLARDIY